jgi:hypothetical protein
MDGSKYGNYVPIDCEEIPQAEEKIIKEQCCVQLGCIPASVRERTLWKAERLIYSALENRERFSLWISKARSAQREVDLLMRRDDAINILGPEFKGTKSHTLRSSIGTPCVRKCAVADADENQRDSYIKAVRFRAPGNSIRS